MDWKHLQVPAVAKMADKRRELSSDCWLSGVADVVADVVCGDLRQFAGELTRLLRR